MSDIYKNLIIVRAIHKSYYCYYSPSLSKSLPWEKVYLQPSPLHSALSLPLQLFSFPLPQNALASQVWSSQILGACLPRAPSEPFSMLFFPPGMSSPSPHSALNSFLSARSIPPSPIKPSSHHPGSWQFLPLLSSCPQTTHLQAAQQPSG